MVLGDDTDKQALLKIYHDAPLVGHPGMAKTLKALVTMALQGHAFAGSEGQERVTQHWHICGSVLAYWHSLSPLEYPRPASASRPAT